MTHSQHNYLLRNVLFVYLALCHVLFLPKLTGQVKNNITHFGIEEGLSDIKCIYGITDSKGYLWICTDHGLNRYDGKTFKKFTPNSIPFNGLANRKIRSIIEREDGAFWVLSNFCLYIFDPKLEIFSPTSLNFNSKNNFIIDFEKIIKIDEQLWICGKGGLFEYSVKEDTFINYPLREGLVSARANFDLNRIECFNYLKQQKAIFLGNEHALLFDLKTKSYIPNQTKVKNSKYIYQDSNSVWAATWGGGLLEYNLETENTEQFLWGKNHKAVFNCILPKNDSILYIGSLYSGLFEFNKKNKIFKKLHIIPKKDYLGDVDFISHLHKDPSGRVWIFTWGGLLVLDNNATYIPTYFVPKEMGADLTNNAVVRSMAPIKEGKYFVAINRKNTALVYNHFDHSFQKAEFLTSEDFKRWCYETHQDKNGNVWISNDGLMIYDSKLGLVRDYKKEQFKDRFGTTFITEMLEDCDKNIYAGTNHKGLLKYDVTKDTFIQHLAKIPGDIPDERVRIHFMSITHDSILMMSTDAYGTYRFDLVNQVWQNKIEKIYSNEIDSTSNFNLYTEFKENTYLIDYHGKPYLVDKNGKVLRELVNELKQPFSSVFAATKLKDESVLLLSTNGLYRVDDNFNVFSYREKEGIKDMAGWSSNLKLLQNGKIFIGKKNRSFNLFDPASLKENKVEPPIVITDIKFIEDNFIVEKQIDYLNQIDLKHKQNFFTISFAALNFTNPNKNQYKYKLDGLHQDWVYNGNNHQATFTDLKPGSYTFHVNGSNNDGVWNPDGRSIKINISPPWYKSTLAYLCYFLLSCLGIYYFWNFQKRKWALNAKLKEEENEARRLKELDETKNKIYTNITHEFRTPLTVIQGLNRKIEGNETIKEKINHNSQNLLDLVNQMLALSKMESGYLKMEPIQMDVIPYFNYITDSFTSMANMKHISLSFHSDQEALLMDADPEKIKVLLSNLILNAIKYTKQYGKIMLSVQQEKDQCIIKVKDSGIGITEEDLVHIFDRFYQVDKGSEGGAGIGLSIVKEFSELMGGSVMVQSEIQKGTTFQVSLPITNNAVFEKALPKIAEQTRSVTPRTIMSNVASTAPQLLLIEDNHDVAYYIMQILKDHYHCIHKLNGVEGLEQARAELPDIIISDIMMPDMNGIEMTKKLKADINTSHIPIILLTAKATGEDKIQGLEAGATAYLTKPFNEEELLVRLHSTLDNQLKVQAHYSQYQVLPKDKPQENIFLQKVRETIVTKMGDSSLGILQICQAVNLERTQVYRKVKALTGMSPSQLIKDLRLRKAKELLLEKEKNVSEVAYECGFKDVSYFSKVFKEQFGVSPSKVDD